MKKEGIRNDYNDDDDDDQIRTQDFNVHGFYSADTQTMNAKALFSLYLYFFITYFILLELASHSREALQRPRHFLPFFHRKACQMLRGTIITQKTGEKMSVPLLRFMDVIG